MGNAVKINTELDVDWQTISYMLVNAFEGGVGYWCQITGYERPKNFDNSLPENAQFKHMSYAVNEGGAMLVRELDEDENFTDKSPKHRLDMEAMARGVQVMADKYPHHFRNMVEEEDDATTGDVLIQCALFGELVYG